MDELIARLTAEADALGEEWPTEAATTLEALRAERDALRKAHTNVLKFIDDYFTPWGAWKTVWWEGEVSDDAAFSADNALKHVANKIRKALGDSHE